jgi:cytochrome oxidase Cu insertion factor (SCO1/SenC/PrrC family)
VGRSSLRYPEVMVRVVSSLIFASVLCAASCAPSGAPSSGEGTNPTPVTLAPAPADDPNLPVGLEVGMRAPDFEAKDVEGKTFKLSDYRGKVVLLDFWGFW